MSNFSFDELRDVRASSHHSLYITKMRWLSRTAIFQITKYPGSEILGKSCSGCLKNSGTGANIFKSGRGGLVNRCEIWQSWHNWAARQHQTAIFRVGPVIGCYGRWKMLSFPTEISDIFHACYTDLFNKYVPSHSSKGKRSFHHRWFKYRNEELQGWMHWSEKCFLVTIHLVQKKNIGHGV